MSAKILTLHVVDQALKAIHADHTVLEEESFPSSYVGSPSYQGRDIQGVKAGMIPRDIVWSGDRGNWMWDGALHVLRAMGVDTKAPL